LPFFPPLFLPNAANQRRGFLRPLNLPGYGYVSDMLDSDEAGIPP
jgi:hypothetical protein